MKRLITATLAALVAVALSMPAFAFVPQRIKLLHPQFAEQITKCELSDTGFELTDLAHLEVFPASVLEIPLVGDSNSSLFLDQNGNPINSADVTIAKMRAANLNVHLEVETGGKFINGVELTVKNAGTRAAKPILRIAFIHDYEEVSRAEFSASVALLFGAEEQIQSKFKISGNFGNTETEISSADASIFAASSVLVAKENVEKIIVDAGDGLSATVKMYKDGRYLLYATESSDPSDIVLREANKSIVKVLKLNTVGLKPEQIESVRIDSNDVLQVYGEDGSRLGTTDSALPVAKKYYLADKSIKF